MHWDHRDCAICLMSHSVRTSNQRSIEAEASAIHPEQPSEAHIVHVSSNELVAASDEAHRARQECEAMRAQLAQALHEKEAAEAMVRRLEEELSAARRRAKEGGSPATRRAAAHEAAGVLEETRSELRSCQAELERSRAEEARLRAELSNASRSMGRLEIERQTLFSQVRVSLSY